MHIEISIKGRAFVVKTTEGASRHDCSYFVDGLPVDREDFEAIRNTIVAGRQDEALEVSLLSDIATDLRQAQGR